MPMHYKPLADSTLERKSKSELIKIIRCLEQNWTEAEQCIDNQEKAFKQLLLNAEERHKSDILHITEEYRAKLKLQEKSWLDKYIALQQEQALGCGNEEFYTLEQMKAMSPQFIERNWDKVRRSLEKLAEEENPYEG